jgi:hypothetical protein
MNLGGNVLAGYLQKKQIQTMHDLGCRARMLFYDKG